MSYTHTIFFSILARVLAIQSSSHKLLNELISTSNSDRSEDDLASAIIEENEKYDDDPCWRRYSGYLYVYEKTVPKVVPAWVNGSKLSLGDNLIALSNLALPLLPQGTDPRCFKMVLQDFGDPLVMCCATMQCRTQWINAITKSKFCNALMLGAASDGFEVSSTSDPKAVSEPTAAENTQSSAAETPRPVKPSNSPSASREGIKDQVENLDDLFDEYLFIIRPAVGQKVEIEE